MTEESAPSSDGPPPSDRPAAAGTAPTGKPGVSVLRRLVRWCWRSVLLAALLLVLGYSLLHLGVRWGLRAVLTDLGLAHVGFTVDVVTPFRVSLSNIRAGEGARIGHLRADFSPWQVISGNVTEVHLSGAQVHADLSGGLVSIDGLPLQTGNNSGTLLPNQLPQRIVLTACVLSVRHAGTETALPFSADWKRTPAGGEITASVWLGSQRVDLLGQVDPSGKWRGGTSGSVDLSTLRSALGPDALPEPLRLSGKVIFAATGDLSGQTYSGTATLNNGAIQWDGVGSAEDVNLQAVFQSGIEGTTLTVKSAAVTRTDAGVARVSVEAGLEDGMLSGSGSVSSNEGTALLEDIQVSGWGDGPIKASLRWRATAKPASRATALLRPLGIEIGPGFSLAADGRLTFLGGRDGDTSGWTLSAEVNALDFGGDRLRYVSDLSPPVGARISGRLAGLRAAVDSGRTTLTFETATVSATEPHLGGTVKVEGRASGEAVVGVEITQGSASWSKDEGLHVHTPDVRILLDAAAVSVQSVQLRGLTGVLAGGGTFSPGRVNMTLSPTSQVKVAAVAGAEGSNWTLDGFDVALGETRGSTTMPTTREAQPPTGDPNTVPTVSWTPETGLRVSGVAEMTGLSGVVEGTRLAAKRVVAEAAITTLGGVGETGGVAGVGLDGRLRAAGLEFSSKELGLSASEGTLDIPVQLQASGGQQTQQGTMSIGRIVHQDRTLPGVTGTVFVSKDGVWSGFEWLLVSEGLVKATAHLDLTGRAPTMDIEAWIPPFEFTRADELRSLLPEALGDADIRGTFSGQVRYFVSPESVVRWGEVEVKNASLRSKAVDAELTGISGRVWTRSFSPLETPPGQTLKVERARLGQFEVKRGEVSFRLDPGDIVFVESAVFGYVGGEVSARGFRVQPGRSAADLVIYADNLDIGLMAESFSDGKVGGSGRMYARLPVSVVWPERVNLGTGYVYAEATGRAGSTGSVRLTGFAGQIGDLVGRSIGSGGSAPPQTTEQIKQRVTSALVDFGFSALTLDIIKPEAGPLTLSFKTNGKGPVASGGQELDLTFNVTGLEEIINAYLGLKGAGIGF